MLHDPPTPPAPPSRSWSVAGILLLGAWGVLSVEALHLLQVLQSPYLPLLWITGSISLLAVSLRLRQRELPAGNSLVSFKHALRQDPVVWIAVAGVLAFASLTLVTALKAPPNTNDSLQYHMSRVVHWAQAHSLAHYATPISRQIWMPPGAEYLLLQLFLLAQGDALVNLVQWASMLGCLVGLAAIVQALGGGWSETALALVYGISLRMGVLQASSTQNDYVTALWAVCLAYYAVVASRRSLGKAEWLLAGLAAGLGVLTKGTFAAFALPFLFWMGVSAWRYLQEGFWKRALRVLGYASLGVCMLILINSGAWSRNFRTYGSPFGPADGIGELTNDRFGMDVLVSNSLRNLAIHAGTPYGDANGITFSVLQTAHHLLGIDINDPATSLDEFRVKRYITEDRAGNPYHLILLAGSLLVLLWGAYGRLKTASQGHRFERLRALLVSPLVGYTFSVLAGFLLFSLIFKWQSTGSRLQLPFFVLSGVIVGVACRGTRRWVRGAIMLGLLASSLYFLLWNASRPLLPLADAGGADLFNTPRLDWLFAGIPEMEPGYRSVTAAVEGSGCLQVGLMIDSHDPEYPFWVLLGFPRQPGLRIEHLNPVTSLERYLPQDFTSCAVICTICDQRGIPGFRLVSTHPAGLLLFLKDDRSP